MSKTCTRCGGEGIERPRYPNPVPVDIDASKFPKCKNCKGTGKVKEAGRDGD